MTDGPCDVPIQSLSCNATDELISLKPKQCSSGRVNIYADTAQNFKGPWLNVAQGLSSTSYINEEHLRGLAALSTTQPPPSEWSWRKKGGNQIQDGSANQGQCGCCWAMASTSVLSDRMALTHDIANPQLSPAWTVMCGNSGVPANCQCSTGGSPVQAGCFFEKKGVKLGNCWPTKVIGTNAPTCPTEEASKNCCSDCCGDKNAKIANYIFKARKGSTRLIVKTNEEGKIDEEATRNAVKAEIYHNGPVVATFRVPETGAGNFMDWWKNTVGKRSSDFDSSPVYIPIEAQSQNGNYGRHAVTLTGYGKQNGVEYWEFRNSWGAPSYCKFGMSSADGAKNTGLVIPFIINNKTLDGGVSAFDADDLPKGYIGAKCDKCSRKKEKSLNSDTQKSNLTLIVLIVIITIVVLITGVFLYHHYKK